MGKAKSLNMLYFAGCLLGSCGRLLWPECSFVPSRYTSGTVVLEGSVVVDLTMQSFVTGLSTWNHCITPDILDFSHVFRSSGTRCIDQATRTAAHLSGSSYSQSVIIASANHEKATTVNCSAAVK